MKLTSYADTIIVEWTSNKYHNLTKGKNYTARARGRYCGGSRMYTDFEIIDDLGNRCVLEGKHLNVLYRIVQENAWRLKI